MALPKLTYEDYKSRISIQEVLQEAGYHLNRKDGLRYPSYVRLGSDGRRVSGDKFIVSGQGKCCFQPPERKNYNIISFIKEHPHLFADYRIGMSLDRLVNVVCHKLLNQPLEERQTRILDPIKERKPFDINNYQRDYDAKQVARFLIPRGINQRTQEIFSKEMFVATKEGADGKRFKNIGFPLTQPHGIDIIGLEQRGYPNKDGKSAYKGLAAGSDAANGMWIANLSNKDIADVKNIYWFESAYDAMAFFQLKHRDRNLYDSVFVSTSGSPSKEQFNQMLKAAPQATHHLCFDRDRSGQVFAVNFALTQQGKFFTTTLGDNGLLKVSTQGKTHNFNMDNFDFDAIIEKLGINNPRPSYPSEWQDYVDSLHDKNKIYSGNPDFMVGDAYKAYCKYESLCEQYYDESHSGLVAPDDLAVTKAKLIEATEQYEAEMKKVFPVPPTVEREIVYEPCDSRYKDWNDQLLDKPITAKVEQESPTLKSEEREAEEVQTQSRGFRR